MWNLFIRAGMVLSTVLVGRQFAEHFWPTEIHPTRLYSLPQVAHYLGTTAEHVEELVKSGQLNASWVSERPRVLGNAILEFLTCRQ